MSQIYTYKIVFDIFLYIDGTGVLVNIMHCFTKQMIHFAHRSGTYNYATLPFLDEDRETNCGTLVSQ